MEEKWNGFHCLPPELEIICLGRRLMEELWNDELKLGKTTHRFREHASVRNTIMSMFGK